MPASTCWQWRAAVRASRPAVALAMAAVAGEPSSQAASRTRLGRLDGHQGLGQAVAHGLEAS